MNERSVEIPAVNLEWIARIRRMEADTDFMAWLDEYEPDHRLSYSGELLGLWEAWKAGRARERA
jgi:hypothetical protein